MATTISKLAIKLVADANGVRTGTLGAEQALTRLSRRVDVLANKAYGGLKNVATSTFGQMLSATAAVNLATQAWTHSVQELSEAYERVGAETDRAAAIGISQGALASLQYAASFAGIADESLSTALVKMQRFLALADDAGSREGQELARIGLSGDDLAGMSGEERFLAIADAIARIDDDAEQVAATMEIFGRSGAELIPLFEAGEESIRAMVDEAYDFGLALSEVDATAIDDAGDAMGRFGKRTDGAWNELAAKLAPGLERLANKGVGVLEALDDAAEGLGSSLEYVGRVATAVLAYLSGPLLVGIELSDVALRTLGYYEEAAAQAEKSARAVKSIEDARERTSIDPDAYDREIEAKEKLLAIEKERLETAEKARQTLLDEQMGALNSLVDQADRLRDSLKDPFEKLRDEIQGARRLWLHDLITGKEFDQFSRGKGQELLDSLQSDAEREGGRGLDRFDSRGTGSVVAGSQAALSAIAANERGIQQQAKRDQFAARQRDKLHVELRRIRTIVERGPSQVLLAGELR